MINTEHHDGFSHLSMIDIQWKSENTPIQIEKAIGIYEWPPDSSPGKNKTNIKI